MRGGRLRRELRAQGSTAPEAKLLAQVADSICSVSVPHLRPEVKAAIAEDIGIRPRRHRLYNRLSIAGGVAALAGVALALLFVGPWSNQGGSSMPGQASYIHQVQPGVNQKLNQPSAPAAQPVQPLAPSPSVQPGTAPNLSLHPQPVPRVQEHQSGTNDTFLLQDKAMPQTTKKQATKSSTSWYDYPQQTQDSWSQGATSKYDFSNWSQNANN